MRTSLPAWTRFDDTLITTTYKGATLTIGYDSSSQITRSSLRWYGQLILVKTPHNRFKFHLDVTNGRPVNPLSPTRAGLIQDAAYHELLAFVKDQIFSFVLSRSDRQGRPLQFATARLQLLMANRKAHPSSPGALAG